MCGWRGFHGGIRKRGSELELQVPNRDHCRHGQHCSCCGWERTDNFGKGKYFCCPADYFLKRSFFCFVCFCLAIVLKSHFFCTIHTLRMPSFSFSSLPLLVGRESSSAPRMCGLNYVVVKPELEINLNIIRLYFTSVCKYILIMKRSGGRSPNVSQS